MRKRAAHTSAVLMLGMVSQVGQVLLLRELLMVFHGNELSIGIILAAWMAWVGIGSGIGVVLAERTNRYLDLLMLSAAGILPALPATMALIRRLRGFFDVVPGAYLSVWDIAVSSFVLMAPVCLLLGLQFVLLSRLRREANGAEDTSGAVETYIGEAAGNILGGILFTFVMVHYLNSFQSAVLVGTLMLVTIGWAGRPRGRHGNAVSVAAHIAAVAALFAAGGSLVFLGALDRWTHEVQWRYLTPEHRLVEIHPSKYGNIAIVQRGDQYSFFQSGHLIFSTAGPRTLTPGLEEQDAAVFAHFAMVQHKRPQRVLLIGGGLRGTLSEIARHPVERIDYVELDEVLTRVARPYVAKATLAVLDDPRVRLLHEDGRTFVKEADEKYDVILVDVPDPATAVLNRYYTQEFFRQVRSLLNSDGVFVIGAVSTAGLRGTAVTNRNATVYHTLRSVFSHVLPAGGPFLFYFATDSPLQVSADVETLQRRYRDRNIQTDGFSHHHFHLLLEPSQLRRVNWILRHHGRSRDAHLAGPQSGPLLPDSIAQQRQAEERLPPVQDRFFINSDFRPIGYYHTLMFWGDLAGAGHTGAFRWLLRIQPWWVLPVAALLLVVPVALRVAGNAANAKRNAHYAVIVAVFTTGLSTMTLQVALLFSFQSTYGFVYEMVGLIVAIFMAGLASGTAFTRRYVARKANMDTLAAVQLSVAALALLIAVVLPRAAEVESGAVVLALFSLVTFVAGLLNGVDFPLAAECYRAVHRGAERSAGTVYGVELFGACLGAALASAVVAPVLGIVACCLLATMANGTAFVVLLIVRRSHA